MFLDSLNNALIAIMIGAIILLVAVLVRNLIRQLRGTTGQPGIEHIFDALQPWLYKAIFAGERAALWGVDELEEALASTDKKAVADSLYALLPDTLLVRGTPLPIGFVKTIVTQAVFESWVKTVYDQVDAFIVRNEDYLRSQVDALTAEAA